jgi:Tfp pilus assembly protein PilX
MFTIKYKFKRASRQRGTIYVVTLGVALLITIISVGALAAARSMARGRERSHDAADARNYALSATEVGRRLIAADSNWRNDYANGTWINNQPLGAGSFSLQVVDPNGALNNADNDPVVLTGVGAKGPAKQMISVTLVANTTPLSCLAVGLDAGGTGNFNSATVLGVSTFSVGSTMTCTNTSFNGNKLEALAIIATGCTGMGAQSILSATRALPSSSAFNYYKSHGTAISLSSVGGTLEQCVLSPASNPFGGQTNALGIYVIDCGGQDLRIRNMRLFGTLVLLNAGSSSSIEDSVNMAPAIANFPTLLVNGSEQLAYTKNALS